MSDKVSLIGVLELVEEDFAWHEGSQRNWGGREPKLIDQEAMIALLSPKGATRVSHHWWVSPSNRAVPIILGISSQISIQGF